MAWLPPPARAAFKTDELDAIGATTASAYKELKEVANTEIREKLEQLRLAPWDAFCVELAN